jgi:hypothetical protein
MVKKKNIFDFLNNISYIKDPKLFEKLEDDEEKEYNIFMIQRYVSMEKKYTSFISFIDKYVFNVLNKEQHYKLLMNTLPKKQQYFTYIKKTKKAEKKEEQLIECLVRKYECSKKDAMDYSKLLSTKEKKTVLESFGVQTK